MLFAGPHRAALGDDVADADTIKLEQEVDALSALNDLALMPDQLSALRGMTSDTAGTLSDPPAPISDEYKAALKDLRAALLSKNQNKIETAEDKVDDFEDKQDPDSDADVDQSDSARQKGPALVKMLSPKQVANYISENADDVDDPTQLLLDAVHHARELSDDDFSSLREDTVEKISVLTGAHPGKPSPIITKVNHLLMRVHHLTAQDYSSQQSSIEDEARQLVGGLDPIPCLRHWMENEMADLLSNPQLGQALTELGVAPSK